MLLPSLIGTVNVPGGAIMSAPMVEENGRALALDDVTKASINLLFRHIGYHVYPLHTSLIILSELLDIPKQSIIKHNVIPMLVGVIVAYLVFYRGIDASQVTPKSERSKFHLVKDFLLGFSPILVILGSVLILKLPFFVAVAIGLVLALMKNLPSENRGPSFSLRLKKLFVSWIDYKLALVIISLMVFKSVIEASGVTTNVASSLLNYGISLPILVLVLGFVTSYIIGTHMAASGILAALFAPIFPQAALGPYASLLLFSIMLGYLISPLHLCLVLTNQYFGVSYGQTLKKLIAPILAMLTIVVVQLFVFL
jgi:integral membrane protein (TIGR00529 family)